MHSYIRQKAPNACREESRLSVTMERRETDLLIRLEGAVNVTSAGELKRLILEGFASGRDLQLDLEHVEEIDITVMQLLWAAKREADRSGASMVSRVSEAAAATAREAGFERFPGTAVEE
jgi:anti-anti-sigma regulatory factor